MTAPAAPLLHAPRSALFQVVGLDELHESPLNPRKHFDPKDLEDLRDSIIASGILEALTVRPRRTLDHGPQGFEIAAGHRRRRAGLLAEQLTGTQVLAPVIVREMTDTEFLECLVISNGQRTDVHPLEEAQGYRALMESTTGYDIKKVAQRIGRSSNYVYDRLRLLKLTPEAQQLFLDNRITTAHAVILSRLTAGDQARAIKEDRGDALFSVERQLLPPDQYGDDEGDIDTAGMKPNTPRELQRWVDKNVRFNPAADDLPELFPETAVAITERLEQPGLAEMKKREQAHATKIVHISYDQFVSPEVKEGDESQRIYGPRMWVRADGEEDSKPCEHAVLGVIVVGYGRGQAFNVCLEKKKCLVHWGQEIRAAKTREKEGGAPGDSWQAKETARQQRQAAQQAREGAERARWWRAAPKIREAILAKLTAAGTTATSPSATLVVDACHRGGKGIPPFKGKSAADVLLGCARSIVISELSYEYGVVQQAPRFAKLVGIAPKTLAAIVDAAAPVEKAAAAPAKKRAAKNGGKRK